VNASRVAIVVQARTSSRRLPGKVLLPLAGAPAIVRMMERVARVTRAEQRVLATSNEASDDRLADVVRESGFSVARGPLEDVLARVLAAVPPECDTVVRLTGDCPLVDPSLVDRHIDRFLHERPWAEYVTNTGVRTQPDGLDVEVVSRDLLVQADRHAVSASDREHVLPWVRRHARTVPISQEVDLSALRWTLDTAADYEIIAAIYLALYPAVPAFQSPDVYDLLLQRPELICVAGHDRLSPAKRASWTRRIREHRTAERAEGPSSTTCGG